MVVRTGDASPVSPAVATPLAESTDYCNVDNQAHATSIQPAIERGQALADISRSALYAFAVHKTISLHKCMSS